MIRFNSGQRAALGDTLRELANYGVAALVFGQLVGDVTVSWWRFLAGAAIWFVLVSFALGLQGE